MKSAPITLPAPEDGIASEQTTVWPEREGIAGIPAVTYGRYTTNWRAMPPHVHDCIEMCYCARGRLEFERGGEVHAVLPGNVFLTLPGDLHRALTNHRGMRMYWLFFRRPGRKGDGCVLGLSREETDCLEANLRRLGGRPFAAPERMGSLFRDFFAAAAALPPGPLRAMTLRTALLELLLVAMASGGNRPTLAGLRRVEDAAARMERDPKAKFTNAQLAAEAGLSETRFTALFRRIKGMPPHTYAAMARLERAKKLLAETDAPVQKIAASLGFCTPQHFAGQFRRTYGMSAVEWRARVQLRV